ncbi:MAG: dolichyl-phosphate-mannose--protein mannosyltransferase, partial [Propioniciclava sp.]
HLRARLADRMEASLGRRSHGGRTLGGGYGPWIWWRPWRWTAGVLFGLAIACKWNSVYVLAVFGVLSVLWDVGARRLAGSGFRSWLALIYDGLLAFVSMVATAAVVYLSSWVRWLQTSGGYGRDWGQTHPDHPWVAAFGEGFASLLKYHQDILGFHTGEYIQEQTHPYDAHPAGWLLMLRPIGLDAVNDIPPGTDGCPGPENCLRVITGMGTPVLWWLAALAIIVCIVWWLAARDWRFGVPVLAAAATYLPWFASTDRPQFFFYTITIIPFTCIGLALVLGLLIGPANSQFRRAGSIIAGVAVGLVVANFAWFYPIFTDQLLPYSHWLWRMWLRSWI